MPTMFLLSGHTASPARVINGGGGRRRPLRLAQGLTVAAQASCESGPFPVHATATRLPVESIPR